MGPLLWILALGCSPQDGADSGTGTDEDTRTPATLGPTAEPADLVSIPDPGTGEADWISVGDIGTPDLAWPVGVVSDTLPYVEGTVPEATGNAYFSWHASADFQFDVDIYGVFGETEWVHLHRGDDLVFGDEIEPLESTASSGSWQVEEDGIYILEVRVPGGGFF